MFLNPNAGPHPSLKNSRIEVAVAIVESIVENGS